MNRIKFLLLALIACGAAHADYLGDFAPATTAICGYYTTYNPSTGAPFTLAGVPAISVYKTGDGTNSATESTTGVTHAEDFDSRTGMNRWCVDTSADGTFYSAGAQFAVVITTGTVNSVSVVGAKLDSFSLNKVAALRPATAGRTVVIDAAGLADANTVKLGPTGAGTAQTARDLGTSVLLSSGTGTGQLSITSGVVNANHVQEAGTSITTLTGGYPSLGIIDAGTAQAATGTTLQLRSAATFADSEPIGASCLITGGTTGVGQSRTVTAYTGSTDTATVATWTTTPTGTITYVCFGTAAASSIATDVWASGTRTLTALDEDNTTMDLNATAIGSVAGNVSGSVASVTGNVAGNVTGSVGSVASGGIVAASFAANAIDSGALAATADAEIVAAINTSQQILTGTCDSGSTTTCVDDALTQAAAAQLQDRLICFDDSWCAMITTFTPASDTVTTTKTAPSTRSAKVYTIFPSTAQ